MKGQRRSMWFVLLAAAVILGSSGAAFGDDFCDLPGFAHLSPDFCVGLNRLVARIDTFLKNYPTILPDKSLGGDLPPFPITEPYQTIDLKGMALFVFNGGPLFTYPKGIDAAHHLEIRNGTISGGTLVLPPHSVVKDLRMDDCRGGPCIEAGKYSLVLRNTVTGAVVVDCPSVVSENVSEAPDGFTFLQGGDPFFNISTAPCVGSNNVSPPQVTVNRPRTPLLPQPGAAQ